MIERVEPGSIDLPPDCEVVVRAIWDYLDGDVSPERAAEIEEHLEWCDWCRAHTDFERRLIDEIGRVRREHAGSEDLRERVRETLEAAGLGEDGA